MPNSLIKFFNQYKNDDRFCLMLIIIAACLAILPIPFFGIPSGQDLTQHLQFASTYHEAILRGDFFPGWAATDNEGFGSIGIRFYPPFSYYLLALSQMLFNDWYHTYWVNVFFWMLVGCFGVYLWAKEFLSPIESACAAMLYAFIPYHLFQIYQASLFAEFAASGVLPFCFLTLTRLIKRGKALDTLLLTITLAVLILTHIPTTMIGFPTLFVYALAFIKRENLKSILPKLLIAVILSLLATSFHWLKLVTEVDWLKHNSNNYFSQLFSYKIYLFPMLYSYGKFVPHFELPIIITIIILLPLSYIWFFNSKTGFFTNNEKKISKALLASGFFCIFMMSALSNLVWKFVPVLQKIQFPWRWLSAASVIGVFAFVFALSKIYQQYPQAKRVLGYPLIIFLASITIYNLTQSVLPLAPLNKEVFANEIKDLQTMRGCDCWHPAWAQNSAFKISEKVLSQDRQMTINQWDDESRIFTVEKGTSQNLRVATFYYPYWQAEINEQVVEIKKDTDGTILLPVGEEKAEVKLNFREPLMLQFALAGSLLTWLFLLISLFFIYRKTRNSNEIK